MDENTRIIVIGGSAGALEVLQQLLRDVPRDLNAAVFVTTHLSSFESSNLPAILARSTTWRVVGAHECQPIERGVIYVAVPDRHLMATRRGVRVTRGPKESRARPSVDVLFRSAALDFAQRTIAVVLTGALDDGTAGAWAVKDRGGQVVVQDPHSADFPSMPQSVLHHVRVDAVCAVSGLAGEIVRMVGGALSSHAATASPALQLETAIALEANSLELGSLQLGRPSHLTCPDCHGTLNEIQNGTLVRYRCHTGHAYSTLSLLAQAKEASGDALWSAIRALEERLILLRGLVERAPVDGGKHEAELAQCESLVTQVRLIAFQADA